MSFPGCAPTAESGARRHVRSRAARGGAALLLALIAGSAGAADDPAQGLKLTRLPGNEPAAPFSVATPDRGSIALGDLRGKVVLLNFWATWCEPCLEEMPALERVGRTYQDRGLVVLALSVDREGAPVVVPFLKRHALTFPVGLDPQQTVAHLYRVWALPSTIIVGRKGTALFSVQGARDWDGRIGHGLFDSLLGEAS
jgi:peroxiredoxin